MKWFSDGDRNTIFFHSYVKERRRRLQINEIQDGQEMMLKDAKSIGEEAVKVFKEQFTEGIVNEDQTMLEYIPKIITEEQKEITYRISMEDEVREAVFSLNSESANVPNGFSGKFFQCF